MIGRGSAAMRQSSSQDGCRIRTPRITLGWFARIASSNTIPNSSPPVNCRRTSGLKGERVRGVKAEKQYAIPHTIESVPNSRRCGKPNDATHHRCDTCGACYTCAATFKQVTEKLFEGKDTSAIDGSF